MRLNISKMLPLLFAGALLASGSTAAFAGDATTAPKTTQCASKWVAAGNNGAKADRYYRPSCSSTEGK